MGSATALQPADTTATVSGMLTAAGKGETLDEAKRAYWVIGAIMIAGVDALLLANGQAS